MSELGVDIHSQSVPLEVFGPGESIHQGISNRENSTNQETLASDLAPVDGGKGAWIFLLASFLFEFQIWGQAYAYGSYLDYHTNNPKSPIYQQSTASISAVGTLVIGGQHFVPLLARGFFRAYPRLIRIVSTTCVGLSALCLLIASFMENVIYLLLFQGIFYGICSGITFTPVILWLSQWFDKRRGLATGIIYSGSGLGGILFPIIITKLLNEVGFAWTLRVMALLSLSLGSLASLALKPRLPIVIASNSNFSIGQLLPGNLNALLSPFAGLSQVVIFLQACAWYTISLYISTYTTSLGFSSSTATGVLSAFNASAVIGYLIIGRLIDVTPYNVVMISSATICSLSAFTLLGFARSLPLVFVFVLVFGLAGGGFSTFMTPISRDLSIFSNQESATIYLALIFIRGLAAVSGPLIGAALYDPTKNSFRLYGAKGFRGIVLWVGSAMIFSAIAGAFAMHHRTQKIRAIDHASLQTH